MTGRFLAALAAERSFVRLVFGVLALVLPAQCLFAVSCPVVRHSPPSEADTAYLAGDFAKAESLYQAGLASHRADPELIAGLVHSLLRQQKTQEASDFLKKVSNDTPNSAGTTQAAGGGSTMVPATVGTAPSGVLVTLRGEVEFRQGAPWAAEASVMTSYKLDPCNPRTRLLFAHISQINSRYATARQQILLAHQFDPLDPEIRLAWIETLPVPQRTTELESYLAAPSGDDAETLRQLHVELDHLKKPSTEPARACQLVSTTAAADLPFINLMARQHLRAFGLEVGLNGTPTRLQLGAGEEGLVVYRSVAEHAGLKQLAQSAPEISASGKPSYLAYADSIKLGGLEFKDCTVKVIDSASPFDDGDGTIGMDVFSNFLLTLDYPMHKVQLGPLPVRPGVQPATPSLKTTSADASEIAADQAAPVDRFIAPEMKDYTPIYRAGDYLIVPAALNGTAVKLFILDLSGAPTSVAPEVAKQASKGREEEIGPPGHSQKAFVADEITFDFAHMAQKVNGVVSSDTSGISRALGMEISGFLGENTLDKLIMHADYRDGLLKFEYIPNRGYKF